MRRFIKQYLTIWLDVIKDRSIFLTMVLSVVFYGFFIHLPIKLSVLPICPLSLLMKSKARSPKPSSTPQAIRPTYMFWRL
ncbi:ABC-type multidrug transport system, permease component [Moraxella catarrhalis]|nr:ABC-type multidrug transport system, permease component [Moraxella catarrhalis]OAV23716.1 ABC-type multidrug transport system, permease component [Moraxella catarrhalis]